MAVLLVVSAACSEKTTPVEDPAGLPAPEGAETTVAGEQPSPPGTDSATTAPSQGSPTAPSETTPAVENPEPGEDPIAQAARSGVGGFARTLLRPEPATRLVLDVLVERGAGPSERTLASAVSTLRSVSGKPAAVTNTTIEGGRESWSAAELRSLADANAPTSQGNGTAAIRVIFVHGGLEGNDRAVGVAVRGDVLAVFADRVGEASSPLVSRSRMEEAILIHEIGHLLGLVDLVLDTGRDDPEHPGHSRNTRSVMYWAVESTLVGQALNGPPSTDFDDQDRADLAKLRSGG